MKRKTIAFALMFFVLLAWMKNLRAKEAFENSWWFKKPKGWFWYSLLDNKTNHSTQMSRKKRKPKKENDPIKQLQKFRKYAEKVKARAVLNPTYKNVKEWMKVNKAIMERSKNFALVSREVLYSSPELDFNKKYPISQVGVDIRRKNEILKIKRALRKISNKAGLIIFFSSSCPYCLKQIQAVQSFNFDYPYFTVYFIGKEENACNLIYEMNFKNFENIRCRADSGLGIFLKVNYYPTIFLGIPSEKKYFLLGEGLLTESDIIDRLLVIGNYNKIIEDDDLPLIYQKIKNEIVNINKIIKDYEEKNNF